MTQIRPNQDNESESGEQPIPGLPSMATAIAQFETYLDQVVAPQANRLDYQAHLLNQGIQALGQQNLFRLRLPQEWGGYNCDLRHYWQIQERLAQYSGALSFVQLQHQAALGLILNSTNTLLRQTYLAAMAQGTTLMGVGFSHLRKEQPLLQATPVSGGYLISGEIHWITGFEHFQYMVVAARLPEADILFGLLPLLNAQQAGGGILHLSLPLSLGVVSSTQTVEAEIEAWFIPEEEVVCLLAPDWLEDKDQQQVLMGAAPALGCTRASLTLLDSSPFGGEIYRTLYPLWQDCRAAVITELGNINLDYHCQLRAQAISLAVRSAQAAIVVTGGSALNLNHTAQRLYREAMLYIVSGLTQDLRQAMLTELQQQVVKGCQ
ncbi:acyl-CoA/acyl-ACP dehydrogenase [Candidatus Synechococcus calcipolaris G9]|uniref:Acyl-CoA/acyl-ACP dehydrogenase n=1 Tax=Candidatus Synechococcus calcipolaris G9 TaxID=1497997 RepID=A0ABT6F2S5_9SYNE|nr:acyl-CoA dehydrogenase family protein [Candidatus Synechococcus calcipolaris]MDG2992153.1 acyl-CoA/acyl-ACP dehydrogenase [Candidatus Synechococcus calcipolaris G9]